MPWFECRSLNNSIRTHHALAAGRPQCASLASTYKVYGETHSTSTIFSMYVCKHFYVASHTDRVLARALRHALLDVSHVFVVHLRLGVLRFTPGPEGAVVCRKVAKQPSERLAIFSRCQSLGVVSTVSHVKMVHVIPSFRCGGGPRTRPDCMIRVRYEKMQMRWMIFSFHFVSGAHREVE
jgi:hypothetical protein